MSFSKATSSHARPSVPTHLKPYIAKQKYELYSAIDHASWRFIMRVSKSFFKNHAHKKYMKGLEQTGITVERIPRITEMDKKLKKFGWGAVTVTGFIPPSVFLEFQSLSLLPIACDMRSLEHIEYTPSPDIVHEAAGHAPFITDPHYASYLHKFGEIARKAIFAKEDLDVYAAIKHLSDIKEDPATTNEQIDLAYKRLAEAHKKNTYASEATRLSRLGWWSIEYGLVKKSDGYKIYGAGLLSSVNESHNAIIGEVKKLPLTLECTNVDYDITKPQPQLFYIDNFKQLEGVIAELAETMAYKIGGMKALHLAQKAGSVTTTVLDSGLQISGVLTKILSPTSETPIYLQYSGPVQLAYKNKELPGHSANYHKKGFGTPVGAIKKPTDLKRNGHVRIEFASGVVVEGTYVKSVKREGKAVIHTFKKCKVTYGSEVLFDPSWGFFDMACGGDQITSVFGGSADRAAYMKATVKRTPKMKAQISNLTSKNRKINVLYAKVRKIREGKRKVSNLDQLNVVINQLDSLFKEDWLLRLEILEIISKRVSKNAMATMLQEKLNSQLDRLSQKSEVLSSLIRRGRELL